MKKHAIFTAVVGNYDALSQPLEVDNETDYILFTNDIKESRIGVWDVHPINYNHEDRTRIARWVKTHPHLLLPEHESSLWLDANIQINTSYIYNRIKELNERQSVRVASIPHPEFDCIYDELFDMLLHHYEHEDIILKWGQKLRKERYPRHNSTFETGLLFRKHHDNQVAMFDELWWNSIEHYSRRDQLSFSYSLWKNNLVCEPFFTDGTNVRNNSSVNYLQHQNTSGKYLLWNKQEAWLCRYAERNSEKSYKISNLYYWIYSTHHPQMWAKCLGQYFRILDIVHRRILAPKKTKK